ncbi:MAG: sigma 54-interacting transcriptional regulator [Acidithiobacillus sp.]|nr:sigma 54-interacting transcriptional regulator [Acidithiobacillus sp.]
MPKKRTPEEETINVARSILYIGSPSIISGSLNTLELSGWAVTFASKIDDAPSILSQTRPAAALVGFDERDLLISGYKIETIIAKYQHVRWIALLPPNALEETSIRKLVGSVFYDYHTQPIQSERLLVVLGHAAGMADIAEEALYIAPHEEGAGKEVEMVGASEAMQRVYQDIRKVASTDAPVLITGESGTGKELAAQAIHERSNRKNGPFIAVNCGALPANLIQSELFGHEKGSFTGAHERKIGRIESATGGTLFLDEIGDLPLGGC